jgi:hypothetical protein
MMGIFRRAKPKPKPVLVPVYVTMEWEFVNGPLDGDLLAIGLCVQQGPVGKKPFDFYLDTGYAVHHYRSVLHYMPTLSYYVLGYQGAASRRGQPYARKLRKLWKTQM